MVTSRQVGAVVLALVLALLLGLTGYFMTYAPDGTDYFLAFFLPGLAVFSVVLLMVDRLGFWFCLLFALEWALMAMSTIINASVEKDPDVILEDIFEAAVTIPIGTIGFLFFMGLAVLVFNKRR